MNNIKEKIYDFLDSKEKEIIEMRRYLHQHPELSFEEFKTSEYIRKFYRDKDIEWLRYPVGLNGVAVKIKGKESGKTIAIRGDFDALPITEETNLPYRSQNPGAMHACGHDAHTAILLGVADALIKFRNELSGDVVIIHQYAEETPPGGAKAMIADGVLDGVDAIIGGHVWTSYEPGEVSVLPGMAMAGRTYFKAVITGKGGHGSMPHCCIDPIVAASHFVVAAQSIVSRNIDPIDSAVVTFGRFEGLGSFNVIPGSVTLEGDIRDGSKKVSQTIEKRFREMLQGIAAAYGCAADLIYERDYPPVINDSGLVSFAERFIQSGSILKLHQGKITMGSEDFSYYQQKIPGLYVFFGAKPAGELYLPHHPKFDINEGCLLDIAKFYAGFAASFLEGDLDDMG